ncbi:hypothetical protein [Gluconobacter morbifer]|uniref:Integral membrane protein n=1 Tax=Gluconobacter morbifer G707 TaxID=1088869 RepID=G6XML5_9PROT|nr:hypothetical protein [Gluconobacter morbifer]EHH67113.1 hypothetical protein GMO_27330 [Gluconobacter morbifer G707]
MPSASLITFMTALHALGAFLTIGTACFTGWVVARAWKQDGPAGGRPVFHRVFRQSLWMTGLSVILLAGSSWWLAQALSLGLTPFWILMPLRLLVVAILSWSMGEACLLHAGYRQGYTLRLWAGFHVTAIFCLLLAAEIMIVQPDSSGSG